MDEFIKAFIEAAMKESARTQNAPNIKSVPKGDTTQLIKAAAKTAASAAKGLYDAYIEVGFVAEQAFELIKLNISKKG